MVSLRQDTPHTGHCCFQEHIYSELLSGGPARGGNLLQQWPGQGSGVSSMSARALDRRTRRLASAQRSFSHHDPDRFISMVPG